jgi:succinate dehydrogenase / fumarate reductase flavoprotein subunit
MERYSPDQMELDARDVVARAIAQEVAEGRGTEREAPRASNGETAEPSSGGGVYLDISHRDRSFIEERLPRMYERFADLGVDMAEEPVEVAPTAHYGMGGVAVDAVGETRVDGLYAIGETMAGVHGANRLGGNSLAETIAFGEVAGRAIAERLAAGRAGHDASGTLHASARVHLLDLDRLAGHDGTHDPGALLDEIRDLLWDTAGIRRTDEGLADGLARLRAVRERASDLAVADRAERLDLGGDITSVDFELAIDLEFMLVVAEAILRGARERTESRGAHFRTAHPETDPDWRRNLRYERDSVGAMRLTTADVGEPSEAVRAALAAGHELDYHQLE